MWEMKNEKMKNRKWKIGKIENDPLVALVWPLLESRL